MKNLLLIFVTVLLQTVTVQAQDWKNYTSENGKFSMEYLGDLVEETNETEKAITYKTTITNGAMGYLISSSLHKNNLESNIDELLNVSVDSFKENIKGAIEDFKRINLYDAKGTYVLFSMSEGTVILEYYVFMKGLYQYQVVMYSDASTYNEEEANHLIDSFKILD